MGLLLHDQRQPLIDMLLRLPNISDAVARRTLVAGLPDALRNSIPAAAVPTIEIIHIVDTVDSELWAQLPDDSWSIIRVVENAVALVRGSRLELELKGTLDRLKTQSIERTPLQPAPAPQTESLQLTADQRRRLFTALLDAFPSRDDLRRLMRFTFNVRLEQEISGADDSDVVFNMIEWAESKGRLAELIAGARQENSDNLPLREAAEQIGLVPASPAPALTTGSTVDTKLNTFINDRAWRARMSDAEVTVCQVEVTSSSGFKGTGTGFLLGPSVVLTCFYMVDSVIVGQIDRNSVVLRFDYKTSADGTTINPGQEYHLDAEWLVDSSPTEQLDYALLRVQGAPGDDPVSGQVKAQPRRWLTPPTVAPVLQPNDPLLMILHPNSGPLHILAEPQAIIEVNAEQTQVSYRVDPAGGSGGAPCFNIKWDLVAMHHMGSPQKGMGVLLAAIIAQPKVKAALGT